MGLNRRRLYLDTCMVIYIIARHPVYSAKVEARMASATDADFCYSPLVRLECLVMPFRVNDTTLYQLYETFFSRQQLLDLPVAVFDAAARLRADHPRLRTPDAIHLAVALHHGGTEFWTNDDRLNPIAPNLVKNAITP